MNVNGRLKLIKPVQRIQIWYAFLVFLFGIFLVRLFYLQIIRHEHYKQSAMSSQLKSYEITPTRGIIKAHNGATSTIPLVLNQKLFTIYADPSLIKSKYLERDAATLASVLGGDIKSYQQKLQTKNTRYVVLARKITEAQKTDLLKHKYAGIGATEQQYRTYPNGAMAAQILGFVNAENKGVYGVEQALNKQLTGKPGKLKAVTDVNGVPLAANTENILEQPQAGTDVVLTLEMSMQKQLETILQQGLKNAKSDSGSAVILDPTTGAVKAMANFPSYDPANYASVEDARLFGNAAVDTPLEIGSTMKPLTMAAALNSGAVGIDTAYYDPAKFKIDGYTITNIEEDGGAGTKNMHELLNLSLNTGATWLLMRMGGSENEITKKGREVWYNYMHDRFRLGQETGIEQGYESTGVVPKPNDGFGLGITYANTAFGQGMMATVLQLGGAYSAALNGGTYYRPHLVDQIISADGTVKNTKPEAVVTNVVTPKVSQELQELMEYVVSHHYFKRGFDQNVYSVGGKTGTAQIAKPGGGYLENDYNGTYAGFVGGDSPQYVIVVVVNKPKIAGYAGSQAAQPIFGDLAHMLIDNFNVTPKGQ
jgi:cell division protein FtsI (penicillin-binding protein 3)